MIARKLKSLLIGALRIGLSAGLLYFIVWKVGIDDLAARLHKVNAQSIILAAILLSLTGLQHARRWMYVLESFGYKWRFLSASQEIWIGYFFNQLLPTSAGGDGVRVLRLYREKLPIGVAFRSVLYERLFALVACVLLGLPAVPVLLWISPVAPATVVVCIAEAAGLLGIGTLLKPPWWLIRKLPGPITREFELIRNVLLDRARTPAAMGISVTMHVTTTLGIVTVAIGMGVHQNALLLALLVPPVILLAMLPVSFAGWGLREGVMVAVLGTVGVNAADSLLLSLIFGGLMLAISLPGAVALALVSPGNPPQANA